MADVSQKVLMSKFLLRLCRGEIVEILVVLYRKICKKMYVNLKVVNRPENDELVSRWFVVGQNAFKSNYAVEKSKSSASERTSSKKFASTVSTENPRSDSSLLSLKHSISVINSSSSTWFVRSVTFWSSLSFL